MTPTVQIRTSIPGPKTRAVLETRERNVPRGLAAFTPLCIDRAHGAALTDIDGNTFLDFAGGLGVLNVGHTAEQLVQAIQAQVGRLTHTCFQMTMFEGYVQLAERLNRLIPGDFDKKTVFFNSGAEAIDNALKIVRAYSKRPVILSFTGSFHGRTMGALSLTSSKAVFRTGFHPFVPGIVQVPFPNPYRCPFDVADRDSATAVIDYIRTEVFNRIVAPEEVGAIFLEVVQGEGGYVVPPANFFPQLQALAREYGILLVVDEIQTGYARTGKMFAVEHFDFVPDVIVTAKSLAGGLPISAITGRAEVLDGPEVGGLGTTFGGNPVSCAAAMATLDIMEQQDLPGRARQIGGQVTQRLEAWKVEYPLIGDVRGLGALRAVEFVRDRRTKAPATEDTKAIAHRCYETGVVVATTGSYTNAIRFLTPLVITDEQVQEGLDIVEAAIEEVSARL